MQRVKLKSREKGFSLIEVVVAIAVVGVTIAGILTTYNLAVSAKQKQKEYLYFEAICYDIDYHYDNCSNWEELYFTVSYLKNDDGSHSYFYDAKFTLVPDSNARYELRLTTDADGSNLTLDVIRRETKNNEAQFKYYVIEKLEYGPGYVAEGGSL